MPPILTVHEQRVLGCLLEKETLTPEVYPLTLNSLRLACNQKTSREPVLDLDESAVSAALAGLKAKNLLFVLTEARASKYRHTLEKVGAFTSPQRALLTLLLLRGPQTSGELRQRSERLHEFTSPAQVEETLESLRQTPEAPWVRHLARRPGEKEARWAHQLGGDLEPEEEAEALAEEGEALPKGALDELRRRMDTLEAEVARLKLKLDNKLDLAGP